jgi:hypothetical protein
MGFKARDNPLVTKQGSWPLRLYVSVISGLNENFGNDISMNIG